MLRLRPLLGVLTLAALAALGLAVPVNHPGALGDDRPAVSAQVAGVARRAIPEQAERPFSIPALGTGTVLVLVLACSATGLVGRAQRRVGDAGDDWRSLLLGAPPGPA